MVPWQLTKPLKKKFYAALVLIERGVSLSNLYKCDQLECHTKLDLKRARRHEVRPAEG